MANAPSYWSLAASGSAFGEEFSRGKVSERSSTEGVGIALRFTHIAIVIFFRGGLQGPAVTSWAH